MNLSEMMNSVYPGEISPNASKIAEIVSMITQPIFIPIPVMLILATKTDSAGMYALVSVLALLFVTVLPTVAVFYVSARTGRKDGDIMDVKDRILPMAIGIVSYSIGTLALYLANAPAIMTVLMLAYVIVTFAMMVITFYWKISMHSVGIIGPSMALGLAFPPFGYLLLILLPIVWWARYVLKKHTPMQLLAGALVGFIITFLLFHFMLPTL